MAVILLFILLYSSINNVIFKTFNIYIFINWYLKNTIIYFHFKNFEIYFIIYFLNS